jgi:hypothetical protein
VKKETKTEDKKIKYGETSSEDNEDILHLQS